MLAVEERMKATFRLSPEIVPANPKTGKPMTIAEIAVELGMNTRSITTLRKGTERGDWVTLVKILRWLSEKNGRQLTLEEILEIEE